ncbi:MAG: hypothetical protein GXO27_00080 [Chlorobi bacterium]|nr:hypothetical protein [Chlorobiota bacterium]
MRKIIPLLLMFLTALGKSFSQEVQIGWEQRENKHLPIEPYFNYSYSQQIYHAAQINDPDGGTVTAIKFQLNSPNTFLDNSCSWSVYIGHTSKTEFVNDTDWVDITQLTRVFYDTIPASDSQGWITVDIDDWTYNGTDNILIAVHEWGDGYDSSLDDFYCSSSPTNQSLYFYSDHTYPDPASPPRSSAGPQPFFANIIFVGLEQICALPRNPQVLNVTHNSATLTWQSDPSDPPSQYVVEYKPANASVWQQVTVSDTVIILTGLTSSTLYEWKVRSDCGGGDMSTPVPGPAFQTLCDPISSFPYIYSFEDLTPNVTADWTGSCWDADPSNTNSLSISGPYRWNPYQGPTPSSETGPDGAYDGNIYAYTEASGSSPGDEAYLYSPLLDPGSAPYLKVSFYYHMHGDDIGTLFMEYYDGTSWQSVWYKSGPQQEFSDDPWLKAEIYLPSTALRIRFRAVRGDGYLGDIAVDYVEIDTVLCPPPYDLNVSTVTDTSAVLVWRDLSGGAADYRLLYKPRNASAWNEITVNDTVHTLTGLTPGTNYEWGVYSACGGHTSDTVRGPNFYTPCYSLAPAVLPFAETWEHYSGTLTGNGSIRCDSTYSWTFESDHEAGRARWGTDAPDAYEGQGSLLMDVTQSQNDLVQNFAILTINLSDYATSDLLELSFYWKGPEDEENSGDKVWIRGSISDAWIEVADLNPGQTAEWQKVRAIDIDEILANASPPQTVSATFQVKFGQQDDSPYNNDGIFYDNIEIKEVTCPMPRNLAVDDITSTTVDLHWDPVPYAMGFEWEIVLPGTEPGTGNAVASGTVSGDGSADPDVDDAGPLSPVTDYEFYVRARCDSTDYSEWAGPVSFTTACPVYVPPYSQDFSQFLPPCWAQGRGTISEGPQGSWSNWFLRPYAMQSDSYNRYAATLLMIQPISGLYFLKEWLVTPHLNLSGGGHRLEFDLALTPGMFFEPASLGSDDLFAVLISPDGGNTWNVLRTWDHNDSISPWGQHVVIDLSGYTQPDVQIAFWGTTGTQRDPDAENLLYVDNVRILPADTCSSPSLPRVIDITDTSADLEWYGISGASGFEWQILEQGQTPGSAQPTASGTVSGDGFASPDVDDAGPLAPSTDYELYIRTLCDSARTSDWTGPVSFITECEPFRGDYLQTFDDWNESCWRHGRGLFEYPIDIRVGPWLLAPFGNDPTHPNGLAAYEYLESDFDRYWMFSPFFDLRADGYRVEFDVAVSDWLSSQAVTMDTDDEIRFVMSTDNGRTWTVLYTWTYLNTPPPSGEHISIDLNGITESHVKFAFWASAGDNDNNQGYNFYVDNFHVWTVNTCDPPSNLRVLNVTTDSAELAWSNETGDTAAVFTLYYREAGATAWDTVSVRDTVYVLSGLTPHSHYEWQVESRCSTGLTGGPVSGPDFWTACPPVDQFPYAYGFEDLASNVTADWDGSCWTARPSHVAADSLSGPFRWTPRTGPTPTPGTGPDGAFEGQLYAYTEASGSQPGDTAYLKSPELNLSGLQHPVLTFRYHMYGAGMGSLALEAYDGSSWMQIWGRTGSLQSSPGDAWAEGAAVLPNGTLAVRFRGIRGTDETSDMAIDAVTIQDVSCHPPAGLEVTDITDVSALLRWQGDAASYLVEYRPVGAPAWDTITVADTAYVLTGLTPHTLYEWQVRSQCAYGVTEGPVSGPAFRTACAVVSAYPYVYGFEDAVPNPSADWSATCWSAQPQDTGSDASQGPFRWTPHEGPTPTPGTGPDGAFEGTRYAYTEASGSSPGDEAFLIGPEFDMSATAYPRLSFRYHMYGDSIGSLRAEIFDGSAWTEIWRADGPQQDSAAAPWKEARIYIPASTRRIRFRGIRGGGDTGDMAVDQVAVENIACPEPADLRVIDVQWNTATFAWRDQSGGNAVFRVEWREAGAQSWISATTAAGDTTYTATGLHDNSRYEWQVTAVCGGTPSETVRGPEFMTPDMDVDQTAKDYLQVYFDGDAFVVRTLDRAAVRRIRIFETTGRLLYDKEVSGVREWRIRLDTAPQVLIFRITLQGSDAEPVIRVIRP